MERRPDKKDRTAAASRLRGAVTGDRLGNVSERDQRSSAVITRTASSEKGTQYVLRILLGTVPTDRQRMM